MDQTRAKIDKMQRDMRTKEDLKTVALGTSKINYLDPRITVAWCKRHEVPIEKVWTSLKYHFFIIFFSFELIVQICFLGLKWKNKINGPLLNKMFKKS